MNKFKLSKIKIIFFVLIIIALILGIFIITNNSELLNNILGEQIYQEGGGVLPLFSYVVCDNQDKDNIKILIRLNSENGLEYVKCPDDQIVYAEGKTQLSIDYTVKENEDKLFSIKEKDKDEVSEVININNDTTQESTLDIERVTDIKGFKSVKLNMKSNLPETYYSNNISYKIGESGAWYTGNAISLLDYDLVRQNLVLANDDGTTTTTLFAKIMDNAGNIVEVSEKLNIDTEVVSESIQEESLLKAIENDNIKTGKYTVEILDKGTTYNLVVYNLEDSIEVVGQLNIGTTEDVATSSTEYAKNMVVLKVNGDLNVVEDAT